MKTRIISGAIGFVLLLAVVIKGGILLDLSILIISLVGLYEFHNAVKKINDLKPLEFVNYLFTIGIFLLTVINKNMYFKGLLFLYLIIILSSLVLKTKFNVNDIAITIFGAMYVSFFLSHMYLLNGKVHIWLVFIIAWGTDTFAYFSGVLFGKRKLYPTLSPKKTVEGSIGGIIGSLLVTLIFSIYFKLENIHLLLILSVIASIMSQIGDLTASRIKRIAGIKDYGNIMPGHGGILDRFDSILFTTPIVYYYITYLL
ncbi:phosphatidate cytidylyltransferase [Gottschalkia purinilytica]|uniref:Phosphatidate cytidylyltransferase n=1 Tax=Gottschalkia purinilytica TaxID=1503 RepID=A0A0L0WBU2_GOTPU|nr:phosphatidate cytidylyltransferase [Gottschalkia purinilytica]KNF08850.1 phosphatidate cytidylyltransferase [Gottschalkia purinilytica]